MKVTGTLISWLPNCSVHLTLCSALEVNCVYHICVVETLVTAYYCASLPLSALSGIMQAFLKPARVSTFPPWKLANSTNQGSSYCFVDA